MSERAFELGCDYIMLSDEVFLFVLFVVVALSFPKLNCTWELSIGDESEDSACELNPYICWWNMSPVAIYETCLSSRVEGCFDVLVVFSAAVRDWELFFGSCSER